MQRKAPRVYCRRGDQCVQRRGRGSDHSGEYVIPFACIRKIGPDIVIVEIQEEKFLQKF